ncbi:MAG TPA: hypothetical protein VHM20_02025, partial [Gammaproteobacteria bacterium]|nr:hypothetical protein [Gammaproteobacteria bacterium]
ENSIQATTILTGRSEGHVKKSFMAMTDIERLAKQMRYWMTNEYIADIYFDKIKEDIYPPETKVTVRTRTRIHPTLGFTTDGIHSDLGIENGQEPVTQNYSLLECMINYIFVEDHLQKSTHRKFSMWQETKPESFQEQVRRRLGL